MIMPNASERAARPPQENLKEAEAKEAAAEKPENLEAGEEAPVSRFEKIANAVKEFWATQVKGEVREETEEEEMRKEITPTGIKVAKAGVPAIAGAMASMFGVKSLIDVPRYLSQKFFSGREKSGLMEAFSRAEETRQARGEKETNPADAARAEVGTRTAELSARIESSKYLTAEKKAELLKKIAEIDAKHAEAVGGAEETRKQEFAKALNDAIETKVKGTTALKETLNTMAIASGLSAARALLFGSVSIFERYQKVSKEREKGERQGSLFHEMVTQGLKETFTAVTLREGETKGERIKNAAEALASIMRFVGMTAVGLNEINQEGISGAISKAIEGLEKSSVSDFAENNFSQNAHHLLKFMHLTEGGGGHGANVAEHVGIAAAVDAGAAIHHEAASAAAEASSALHQGAASAAEVGTALHQETVTAIQEGIHVGESQLEVGAKIQEETKVEKKEEEEKEKK